MYSNDDYPIVVVGNDKKIISFTKECSDIVPKINIGLEWPELVKDLDHAKVGYDKIEIGNEAHEVYKLRIQEYIDVSDEHITIKGMIDAIPEAALIVQDKKVMLANERAKNILSGITGKSLDELLQDASVIAEGRLETVMTTGQPSKPFDYKIHLNDGKIMYVEVSSNAIEFQGNPAVISIARDVTYKKSELDEAARVQQLLMTSKLPHVDNLEFVNISIPSKTVSGDFYFYERVSENKVIGILGDVRGKGISAALKISALEMLFRESVAKRDTLMSILTRMNKKVLAYFNDVYVAALLFSIDSKTKKVEVVGAGINEFKTLSKENTLDRHVVKGPFLGMFEGLDFDVKSFDGEIKRLILYTDGFLNDSNETFLDEDTLSILSLSHIKSSISKQLKEQVINVEGLPDDCTMIVCDINFVGSTREYVLSGLSDYKVHIPKILKDISLPSMEFQVQLVLMELITNAFKYGNKRDPELPIKVSIKNSGEILSIEVFDMNLTQKDFKIKTGIMDDELMDESGRGLFIVSQFSDKITICERSIVVELRIM